MKLAATLVAAFSISIGAADMLEKGHMAYGVILVSWACIFVISAFLQWSVAD